VNYTSIEQSRKLVELGLNPETADMCFDLGVDLTEAHLECDNFITYFTNDEYPEMADRYVPVWSLGQLLEMIPFNYHFCVIDSKCNIVKLDKEFNEERWFDTPFEAAYNMVIWLLENNYIKAENS